VLGTFTAQQKKELLGY